MDAVGDQFRKQRIGRQDDAHNTRFAVVERAHGVEGVSGTHGPGGDCCASLGGRGIRVPQGDTNPARRDVGGQFASAGQFGRNRHQADAALGSLE